jgi:N-acetylmuramoyl-L-alanine amidase
MQTVVDSSARTEQVRCSFEQIRTFAVLRIGTALRDTIMVRRMGANELALVCVRRAVVPVVRALTGDDPQGTAGTGGRWSLDVIVIDAGHGGKDVGAEGVNGAFEKDVTLAIARKLRDALRRELPNTKVVMTRETDEFIELYRRTEIANDAGGKLFMSIHCNSMPSKPHPAHGCETYILRPGRNDDAARVAQRENASVRFESSTKQYQSMTQDQIIVATMAQRSFVRFSESLASSIQSEVTGSCPLADRGVSQAGFFVLVGASMPNVLVETGFLSNTGDAQYLASSKGQGAIATALAKAISRYARDYQRTLNR